MKRFFRLQIGSRLVKTGLAVFITSYICHLLGLSAKLAVITAIVTIEPTVSDSIRKGIVRLPASAIGAALAVISAAIWGESAITYAVATVLTIFICMKLKLEAGALVATLTAAAMIPDISDNLLYIFFTRLGTTLIGLTVSTLVNFLILPPKYTPLMKKGIEPNLKLASKVLEKSVTTIMELENNKKESKENPYVRFRNSVQRLSELVEYQEKEWRYHKIKLSEAREHSKFKQKIIILEKIALHIGNLQYMNEPMSFLDEEKRLLHRVVESFKQILQDPKHIVTSSHQEYVQKLDDWLTKESEQLQKSNNQHFFTAKTLFYYELISLYDTLCELGDFYYEDVTKRSCTNGRIDVK